MEISPIVVDRAIVWCINENQKRTLENMGDCYISVVARVTFRSWNPKSQFFITKIECSYGWTGVEGLMLNMWNIHVFKVIGNMCGELLNVDKSMVETTSYTMLDFTLRG